jgi:hypothetical protein
MLQESEWICTHLTEMEQLYYDQTKTKLSLVRLALSKDLSIAFGTKLDQHKIRRYSWLHSDNYATKSGYRIKTNRLLKDRIPIGFCGSEQHRFHMYHLICAAVCATLGYSSLTDTAHEKLLDSQSYVTLIDDPITEVTQQFDLFTYLSGKLRTSLLSDGLVEKQEKTLKQRVSDLERRVDELESAPAALHRPTPFS